MHMFSLEDFTLGISVSPVGRAIFVVEDFVKLEFSLIVYLHELTYVYSQSF